MMLREPWRTRLLFVSFAVNLVTIPLALTRLLPNHHPHRPPGGPHMATMVERMAGDLPPGDADKFRAVLVPKVPDIEVSRARMEAARAAIPRAFGQTPYEEASVRAAMQRWQQAWTEWSGEFGEAVLTALHDVSPEGRQKLSQAGQRHPPPPP